MVHKKVPAAAFAAFQASFILRRIPLLSLNLLGHDYLLVRSVWVYRFRCRAGATSPGAFTPGIDAD